MKRILTTAILGCGLLGQANAQLPANPGDVLGADGLGLLTGGLQQGLGTLNGGFNDNVGSNPMFQDGVGQLQGLSNTLRMQLIDPINGASDGALLGGLGDVGVLLIDINTMELPGLPGGDGGTPDVPGVPGLPDLPDANGLTGLLGGLGDNAGMLEELLSGANPDQLGDLADVLSGLADNPPTDPGAIQDQLTGLAPEQLTGLLQPLLDLLSGANPDQLGDLAGLLTGLAENPPTDPGAIQDQLSGLAPGELEGLLEPLLALLAGANPDQLDDLAGLLTGLGGNLPTDPGAIQGQLTDLAPL